MPEQHTATTNAQTEVGTATKENAIQVGMMSNISDGGGGGDSGSGCGDGVAGDAAIPMPAFHMPEMNVQILAPPTNIMVTAFEQGVQLEANPTNWLVGTYGKCSFTRKTGYKLWTVQFVVPAMKEEGEDHNAIQTVSFQCLPTTVRLMKPDTAFVLLNKTLGLHLKPWNGGRQSQHTDDDNDGTAVTAGCFPLAPQVLLALKDAWDSHQIFMQCTCCSNAIHSTSTRKPAIHPTLKVIICHRCLAVYNHGEFTVDEEDGMEIFCQWCGDGGETLGCDGSECSHIFCQQCITRVGGPGEVQRLLLVDPWKCYVCDPVGTQNDETAERLMIQHEKARNQGNECEKEVGGKDDEEGGERATEVCKVVKLANIEPMMKAAFFWVQVEALLDQAKYVARVQRQMKKKRARDLAKIEKGKQKQKQKEAHPKKRAKAAERVPEPILRVRGQDKREKAERKQMKETIKLHWREQPRAMKRGRRKPFYVDNDISRGREQVPLQCINEVDEDRPPPFTYINKSIEGEERLYISRNPYDLTCCDCTDGCRNPNVCACARMMACRFPYNRQRKLQISDSEAVYECNYRCRCHAQQCKNRAVGLGIRLPLQIFKTKEKGWGVRCLEDIPAGTFVCDYVGELLTEDTAEQRGQRLGDEYLLNLDTVYWAVNSRSTVGTSTTAAKSASASSITQDVGTVSEPPAMVDASDGTGSPNSEILSSGAARHVLLEKYGQEQVIHPHEDQNILCIDAKWYGNVARFLNHSCDPVLCKQSVFVDTHDPRMPRLAYFALQDIPAMQELTWDYGYISDSVEDKSMTCRCGAANCRGKMY